MLYSKYISFIFLLQKCKYQCEWMLYKAFTSSKVEEFHQRNLTFVLIYLSRAFWGKFSSLLCYITFVYHNIILFSLYVTFVAMLSTFKQTRFIFFQERNRSIYLNNMSDLLALYIDMELKASKKSKEDQSRICTRLISYLYVYLGMYFKHCLIHWFN